MSIYLDHNATTPLSAEVRAALLRCSSEPLANPSSAHAAGRRARDLLDDARHKVAQAVGARDRELVFCSGGTEANGLALGGVAWSSRRPRIAISAIEHSSVADAARAICARAGKELIVLPVRPDGYVDVDAAEQLIDDRVALLSVMHANHETGAIQPTALLADLVHRHGGLMHVDAAQSLGRVEVDRQSLGADLLSLSGHKIGAPQGIGALVVADGCPLVPASYTGHHEDGRRPGTPNLIGAICMATACQQIPRMRGAAERLRGLRDLLAERLRDIDDSRRLSPGGEQVLAQTLLWHFGGANGEALVLELADREVQVSTGAACSSGLDEPSAVLLAMGVEPAHALCVLRFSLGIETGIDEIERAAAAVVQAVAAVRAHSPSGSLA